MRPGDIFFTRDHSSKISKLFAWFMGSRWSHCGLIYDSGDREIYTIETTDFQVTPQFFRDYDSKNSISYEIWSPKEFTLEDRDRICINASKLNEQLYGYLQLPSFAIRRLLKRIGIKIKHFIRQGLVCTHVVTYGYQGAPIMSLDDPESVDTQDLYELVTSGGFEKVAEKRAG